MGISNPFLRLARRALRRKYDRRRLRLESRNLWATEASGDDVYAALEWMGTGPRSVGAMFVVVRICRWFLLRGGRPDLAGGFVCQAGNHFRARFERRSLRVAAACYRLGRVLLGPRDEGYVTAMISEGVALCRLAELGAEPEENASRARWLCAEARPYLVGHPSLRAEAMMVWGRAFVLTAKATLGDRQKYLTKAVTKCRAARRLYDAVEPGTRNAIAARFHEGVARVEAASSGISPRENLAEAVSLYREVRHRCGPETGDAGAAMTNEGQALLWLADLGQDPEGNIGEALSLFRHSRRILDPADPEFRIRSGRALLSEGAALSALAALGVDIFDNLRSAIQRFQEVRGWVPPDTPEYGAALHNEAAARCELADRGGAPEGNLRVAIELYTQAGERCPETSLRLATAVARSRLAARQRLTTESDDSLEVELDQLGAAISAADRGLELADPDGSDSAKLLEAMAHLHSRRADVYIHVVELQEMLRTGGVYDGESLRTPKNLALIHGELERAAELHALARERFAKWSLDHGASVVDEAAVWLRLARWGGRPAENRELVIALTRLAEGIFEPGRPSWCTAGRLQAAALRESGSAGEAYSLLQGVIEAGERMRAQMSLERDRIAFTEEAERWYADMIRTCIELGAGVGTAGADARWRWEAWHYAHRAKSRALLDLLGGVRPSLRADCQSQWAEYRRAAEELRICDRDIRWLRGRLEGGTSAIAEGLRPEADAGLAALRSSRDRLDGEFDARRRDLVEQAGDSVSLQVADVPPPAEVVTRLRELAGEEPTPRQVDRSGPVQRTLLIEFFLLDENELAVFLLPLWEEVPSPTVIIQPVRHITLRTVPSLLSAAARLSGEAAAAAGHYAQAPEILFEGVRNDLGALVEPWGPYLDEWEPTDLVLAPHSHLAYLPLHAADWKGRPLIERFPVSYLPSPALAPELARRRKTPAGEALLVGNPTGDLAAAEAEVGAVARRLRRGGFAVRTLVGEEATVARVTSLAPEAAVVHCACHSELNEEDFPASGVRLHDGRLTVQDVSATLELRQAALVYLSSCDSAKRVLGNTAELLALARVFFHAGCPSVLATLWPLDENAGNYFADFFYKYWIGDRKPLAVAVQQATLRVREEYPNPCHWAPFVLMGAWSTVVGEATEGE